MCGIFLMSKCAFRMYERSQMKLHHYNNYMLRYVLYTNSESEIWKNIGDQVDIRVVGFLKCQGCMQ